VAKARQSETGSKREREIRKGLQDSRSLRRLPPKTQSQDRGWVHPWRQAINGAINMKINSKDFRVGPGGKVKLSEWPTIVKPYFKSKKAVSKAPGRTR